MKIAFIYHDKNQNHGRQGVLFKEGDKEKNALSVNLHQGYWKSQPIAIVEMTKEQIAAALVERQKEWDELKASETIHEFDLGDRKVTVVPDEMRLSWESVYTDGKGKIIAPKYSAVFGFRRSAALLGAIALRRKLKLSDFNDLPVATNAKGEVTDTGLPVTIEHYTNEFERVHACLMENFGKTQGLSDVTMDWPTIMQSARDMRDYYIKAYKKPITEAMLTEVYKKGSGAKAFYLTQLDSRYPDLKIIDNVILKKTPGEGLDRETLRKLRDDTKTTKETVAAYLADPKKARQNVVKAMTGATMLTFEKGSPSRLLREFMKAIRQGDNSTFYAFAAFAVKVDAAAGDFFKYLAEQEVLKESMAAKGESLPDLTEQLEDEKPATPTTTIEVPATAELAGATTSVVQR